MKAWLKKVWKKLTKPIAERDETKYPPQGGPYGIGGGSGSLR
jgi:hypothetical protein